MRAYVLLYDSDCRLCSFAARIVRVSDIGGRVRALPIRGREAALLLDRLPRERWLESMHVVDPEGTLRSAGDALISLVEPLAGRGFREVFERSPRLTRLAHVAYASLAKVRGVAASSASPRAST